MAKGRWSRVSSLAKKRIGCKAAEVAALRVNIPYQGKRNSKAEVAATLPCKDKSPLLRVKRGCAAHGAVQEYSFLLNRIALGAVRGPAACQLTSGKHLHLNMALPSPFTLRHHFAPLRQPHKYQTHLRKAANNNKKTSALRLEALHNDAPQKVQHIVTGC